MALYLTHNPSKYVYKNNTLQPGILEDLHEILRAAKVKDVVILAEDVGAAGEKIDIQGRGKMSIYDLECWDDEEYADAVGPVWFYGGPELDNDDKFVMIQGTLLTWLMDRILFYATVIGPDIWDRLRFEECSFQAL